MHLVEELSALMKRRESANLEFKEAKNNYDSEKLTKYCCALANEGGGKLVLGVTDKFPRKIVGSQACRNLEKTKADLISRLHIRIEAEELIHDEKRVVLFSVPPRPIGVPLQYQGIYWMRRGEELVSMTPDMLKRIFNEAEPDFSALICPHAKIEDLDKGAIKIFRDMWMHKSGNHNLKRLSEKQLLKDIGAIQGEKLTYAALILFGSPKSVKKFLAQSEVIFEYRSSEATGPAQHRVEYTEGFFSFYDDLWNKINLRNDLQHFQDGLFIWDIPTFNEKAIREAILNGVSHRDYRSAGSIWIRQFPRKIVITSPGGFPPGINESNLLWSQQPRNRVIAEIFSKCGLIERAGQGADRIFEESIRESKPLPDYSSSHDYEVTLKLDGQIQDESFLRFLEKIGQEKLSSFNTIDFLVLDRVHNDRPIPAKPPELKMRLKHLVDLGIVECIGKGKGARYMLCQQYYSSAGKSGMYTRKRGLDKETSKELLLKHLKSCSNSGSKLNEIQQVLPFLSRRQVQYLLLELKSENKAHSEGKTSSTVWFPG